MAPVAERIEQPHVDVQMLAEGQEHRVDALNVKIIQQQALWLPLAHPKAYALMRKQVEGYQVSPFGRQDFSKVRLTR